MRAPYEEVGLRPVHLGGRRTKTDHCIACADAKLNARISKRLQEAFKAARGHRKGKDGVVYVVTCASFPGYVKIGRTADARKRLTQYQTSSPFRDFELVASRAFEDCHTAEEALHKALSANRRDGEWFQIATVDAVSALYSLHQGSRSDHGS